MKAYVETLKRPLYSWVLLGPFFIIASLTILLFRAPDETFFLPGVAVIGLVLTGFLHFRGLVLSLALLLAASLYHYTVFSWFELLWWSGAVSAIALSFVITHLSISETESYVLNLAKEENEAQLARAGLEFEKDKTTLKERIQGLEGHVKACQKELEVFEKVQELARTEIIANMAKEKQLEADLHNRKTAYAKLEEKLEDLQDAQEGLKDANRELHARLEEISRLKQEVSRLKTQQGITDQAKVQAESRLQEIQMRLTETENALQTHLAEKETLQDKLQSLTCHFEQVQKELFQKEEEKGAEILKLQALVKQLEEPPLFKEEEPFSEKCYRRLSGLYKQLRDQFEEKSHLLDQSRKELFLTTEKLYVHEIEQRENELAERTWERELHQQINLLNEQNQENQEIIAKLEAFHSINTF